MLRSLSALGPLTPKGPAKTHPQLPRFSGQDPATDTEGTLTVTNPEENPDTHVCADGGLPGPRAARAGRAPVEIITAVPCPWAGRAP